MLVKRKLRNKLLALPSLCFFLRDGLIEFIMVMPSPPHLDAAAQAALAAANAAILAKADKQ